MKSLENLSSTGEVEWEPFESDAHAAEAQLLQELSEAISYEDQVAGDIKGLVQLMESEASKSAATTTENQHSGRTNSHNPENEKPAGLKRRYSLTAVLELRDSVWEQTQAKEMIQEDERPSKSQKHWPCSASASASQIKNEDYMIPSEQQPFWPMIPSPNVQQIHRHRFIQHSSLVDKYTTALPDPAQSPDTSHIYRHHSVPHHFVTHHPQANRSALPHLDRPAPYPLPKAALPPQQDYYKRSLTAPSSLRRNIRYFDPQPPSPARDTETPCPNHIMQTPFTAAAPATYLQTKLSYTNPTMQPPLATTSPVPFLEPQLAYLNQRVCTPRQGPSSNHGLPSIQHFTHGYHP
ncbi:MAG: hypothetical protein Q9208_000833 [Pyrenodesmia sp. 3 TL-2023]